MLVVVAKSVAKVRCFYCTCLGEKEPEHLTAEGTGFVSVAGHFVVRDRAGFVPALETRPVEAASGFVKLLEGT